MKKVFALLIALVVTCSALTACGNASTTATEEPVTTKDAPTETEKDTKIEEPEEEKEESEVVEEPEAEEEPEVVEDTDVPLGDTTVDVIAVEPGSSIGLTKQYSGGMPTISGYEYDAVICKALTTQQETIWLYLTPDEYRSVFNSDMSFNKSGFGAKASWIFYACPTPVRISGSVLKSDDVVSGLADKIGSSTVMEFISGSANSSAYINEVSYSENIAPLTCVKTKIVSIVPDLALYSAMWAKDVVCRAETSDGKEIWIVISAADYNAHIDANASLAEGSLGAGEADVVTYTTPLTLHGISYKANDIASDLADAIGCETIFWLRSF